MRAVVFAPLLGALRLVFTALDLDGVAAFDIGDLDHGGMGAIVVGVHDLRACNPGHRRRDAPE